MHKAPNLPPLCEVGGLFYDVMNDMISCHGMKGTTLFCSTNNVKFPDLCDTWL